MFPTFERCLDSIGAWDYFTNPWTGSIYYFLVDSGLIIYSKKGVKSE